MSSKQTVRLVDPMRQLDDLLALNNRIEALLEASADALDQVYNSINVNSGMDMRTFKHLDRGILFLHMAQEHVANSAREIEVEYEQLSSMGIHNMALKAA